MKKVVYSVIVFLFSFFLNACVNKKPHIIQNIKKHLKEGDLVFRRGTSIESSAVLLASSKGVYSHVGIVSKDERDKLVIIHAVPGESESLDGKDRVKKDAPEQFYNPDKAISGAIMRVQCASIHLHEAAAKALTFYTRRIEFDHEYNDADTTRLYCTELVYLAYKSAGVLIASPNLHKLGIPFGSGYLRYPSDIQHHPNVKCVFSY